MNIMNDGSLRSHDSERAAACCDIPRNKDCGSCLPDADGVLRIKLLRLQAPAAFVGDVSVSCPHFQLLLSLHFVHSLSSELPLHKIHSIGKAHVFRVFADAKDYVSALQ